MLLALPPGLSCLVRLLLGLGFDFLRSLLLLLQLLVARLDFSESKLASGLPLRGIDGATGLELLNRNTLDGTVHLQRLLATLLGLRLNGNLAVLPAPRKSPCELLGLDVLLVQALGLGIQEVKKLSV